MIIETRKIDLKKYSEQTKFYTRNLKNNSQFVILEL